MGPQRYGQENVTVVVVCDSPCELNADCWEVREVEARFFVDYLHWARLVSANSVQLLQTGSVSSDCAHHVVLHWQVSMEVEARLIHLQL